LKLVFQLIREGQGPSAFDFDPVTHPAIPGETIYQRAAGMIK